ncbi:MAG: hypothetical protein ACI9WU_001259 [Myxococcota bacterium]
MRCYRAAESFVWRRVLAQTPTNPHTPPVRSLIRLLLAVLLTAAAGEALLRWLSPQSPLPPAASLELQWSANPRLSYVPDRVLKLAADPTDALRVVLLGDELTTQAEPRRRDQDQEIIDLSVPGYCALAKVEMLRQTVQELMPERVILVVTPDDHRGVNHAVVHAPGPARLATEERQALHHSHLLRLTARQLDWFGLNSQSREARFERNMRAIGEDNVRVAFEELAELARRFKFTATIALWPGVPHRNQLATLAAELGMDSIRLGKSASHDLSALLGHTAPARTHSSVSTRTRRSAL